MKMMKKIGVSLLALAMTLSVFLPSLPSRKIDAASELVNVAPLGTALTENGDNDSHVIANVNDGNITTSWQTKGVWPSTAVIQLDMGRSISEVVVDLGEDDDEGNGNTCDVTVKYAINGVISDLVMLGQKTMGVGTRHTFKPETPITASHIYVVLDNPKTSSGATAGFWPSVQEIEIYEKRDTSLSTYSNIASQAVITTDGTESTSERKDRLVDGNESTLYKFHDAKLTAEKYVLLSYEEARKMDAFRIVFEHVDSEPYNYQFNFSILAQNSETDGDTWDTIANKETCNRTDDYAKQFTFEEKTYNKVKIVMHSCTNNDGDGIGWPAIAEFEVYGNNVTVTDKGSVANGKPVHVSSGKATASNIVDGNKLTQWKGDYYPAYADIDLQANYDLSAIEVYTPASGYSQYSIYTSLNGRDFTKLAEKTSKDSANADTGESYDTTGTTARYVRVYMEYNSSSVNAYINEVRVIGTPSDVPAQAYPTLNVPKFEGSAYDVAITAQDTYEEIYGIIDRRLGNTYRDWFSFELTADQANGYDYFEISAKEGKVHIKGNEGVSITMGLNHYLKYLCNVHISQVGDQVTMPAAIVLPENPIHMETKAKVRYSYNYCTLSYSMAFYGEKEWRDELDWLALNGANVILDATAQEEVWRRFLGKLGYDHASTKDYIAGPAYYAWAYMANLSGFGGPVHDSWFAERTELARKNQLSMRKLGMEPCLQGYSGMVPTDIKDYDANVNIIAQGGWCSFQRPAMLRTTDAKFDEYAALFYACQEEVYGDISNYYATDPFHEGGNTGGMNSADISREVLNSMLAADSDAIWVIQAWQGNPTTALLNGLDQIENGASHALVLDLYAEKDPHNQQTGGSYGDTKEFDDTPWVYCMLNNFGGRLGLHGHLDNMAREIPLALNRSTSMAGIGIAPEASVNNPVLYDFIFESCWVEDATATMEAIDLTSWLKAYATRRYGAQSDNADEAWMILKDTVYKASLNGLGQGAPESIVNARPALSISAASTWGNSVVSYEKGELEKVLKLLLKDYDQFKDNEAYMYDIANVEQQVLSNSAQEVHKRMAAAFNSRDLATFEKEANTFMEIVERMELVTGTTEYFMLGRWVEMAKSLGENADDFTKDLYEFNAKAIITTWGSYNQAESGRLKDYSNRQWNGLIGDFYKARWERWINARKAELAGQTYESNINWFEWEWEWARSNKEYSDVATPQNLKTLGEEILANYSSANPAADDSKDVPVENNNVSVETGSFEPNNDTEGDPSYVLDGNPNTIWHTDYNGSPRDKHYLIFTFNQLEEIDSMRFLQRNGTNGCVTKFSLYYRKSIPTKARNVDTTEWIPLIEECAMEPNSSWQQFTFDPVQATQVKFVVNDAKSSNGLLFGAAAEVRFTNTEELSEIDRSEANEVIAQCAEVLAKESEYTPDSFATFKDAYDALVAVNADESSTQSALNTAIDYLLVAKGKLQDASIEAPEIVAGVEARFNTNRIYWEAVKGATGYKVLRSETKDGTFTTLFSDAITATEYVDTTAGTDTQYFYKVQVTTAEGTFDGEAIQDTYKTGYEALHEHAKSQLHKSYVGDSVFDGTRIETMSAEETAKVATLNKGTVLLVFKPSGESTGSRQIIWGIKNSSTTTNTAVGNGENNPANNVSYFLYNQVNARYDYGYALRSGVGSALTANAWTGWGVSNTTFTSGNNIVHSLNGAAASGYGDTKWDNFLSKLSGLDKMYIGGSVNGSTNVAMFKGEIAYVTVTDEVLSADEMNAYTNTMKTLLTARETAQLDYTAYNFAIESTKEILEIGNEDGVYTEASWNTLVQVYETAKTIPSVLELTQNDIDTTVVALNAALTGLVKDVLELNEGVEARYSSNRIFWNVAEGATGYKVYRSESIDGTFTELASTTATEYVDENAETGKMYYYQIEVTFADKTKRTDVINDTFVPGIEAVHEHAKEQLHKDYTDNPKFDGTRVEAMGDEDINRIKGLTEATVLLAFKPDGSATSSNRQIIWNIKNSSTTTATANSTAGNPANNISYLTYTSGSTIKIRYDHGYGLKADMAQNANADEWNVFAVSHDTYTSGNNILHSVNGTTVNGFGSAQWNSFVSKMSGLDKMYIGGSVNGSDNVAMFNGNIAYVTITDEIMSQVELNEYTTALKQLLIEMYASSKDTLNDLIEEFRPTYEAGNTNSTYTSDSWVDFTDAFTNALNVLADENATTNEIASAVDTLRNAYDDLAKITHQLLVDKTAEIVEVGNQLSDYPLRNIFDGNANTFWYTSHEGSERSTHHFTIKVPVNYYSKLELLARPQNGNTWDANGVIKELKVYAKLGETGEWIEVAHETGLSAPEWQTVTLKDDVKADYLKVEVIDAGTDTEGKNYASLAELKIYHGSEQVNKNKWKAVAYFSNGDNAEYDDDNTVDKDYELNGSPTEGPAEYMFDGNPNTHFHTNYDKVSEPYYSDPFTIIVKLGEQETFNYVNWLSRLNAPSCRLQMFELYTIDDDKEYADAELKLGAPWVKKFAMTAENKYNAKFYVGEQTTKYLKIVCNSSDGNKHLTCAELDLFYEAKDEAEEIKYTGTNATLDSDLWIKESAYNQYREAKGYYGTVNSNENSFSSEDANLIKYVTSSVLSIKAQSTVTEANKINVRFITSIASKNLEELRFKVEVINPNGSSKANYLSTNKVYKTILANDVEISDAANVFGNDVSTSFAVCKLNNIPATLANEAQQTRIKVTPYWAPMDVAEGDYDNYVEGIAREFTIKELFDNAKKTEAYNVNE